MNRFLVLISLLILSACSRSDRDDGCRFLVSNAVVDADINLNLPQYEPLRFTGNTIYIQNQGIAGVFVSNAGNGNLRAFDAADPAHAPTSCSRLNNVSGIGTCGCSDENEYSLLTGQPVNGSSECLMREYRVESIGTDMFRVYN